MRTTMLAMAVVAGAIDMLARHHERAEPIALVTAPGPLVGRTAGGTLVVAAPVDCVAWTERVGRFARRDDLAAPDRIAWLSGQTSPGARKAIEARGWKTSQRFAIAAAR